MRNWYELPFGSDYTSEDDEMRDSITEDMEMLLDRCYDDIRICNLRIQQFTLSADQALDLEDLKADRSCEKKKGKKRRRSDGQLKKESVSLNLRINSLAV